MVFIHVKLSFYIEIRPRACGVLSAMPPDYCFDDDPSPRVRGSVFCLKVMSADLRSIPACAGFWIKDYGKHI